MTLLVATLAWRSTTSHPTPDVERQMTVAGATAVEAHWSRAEIDGDTSYLEQLLVPGYRSVNADGSIHRKSAIVAGAGRNGTRRAAAAAAADSFLKVHPARTSLLLYGNTAIATFVSLVPSQHEVVRGVDVFAFTDGRWHALYSQHNNAQ